MAFTFASEIDNAEMGAFFASLFRFFNVTGVIDTRNQVTQRLRPLMGPDMRDFFSEGSDTRTGHYIATDSSIQVILIDGAKTSRQVLNLCNGYSQTGSTFSFQGRNQWLRDFGLQVSRNATSQALFLRPNRQLIVGYSAGGAAALWVAKHQQSDTTFNQCRILTFGAPRSMSLPDLESIRVFESCRWMNDTDPIPLVPPRFDSAPLLALGIGVNASLVNGTYVHKNPGLSLAPDGVATFTTLPLVASADVTGSLANWYFSKEGDPNNTHAILEYEIRLTRRMQLQVPPPVIAAPERRPEPAQNAPSREVRQVNRHTESQVAHAASTQNATPTVVQAPALFRAVRFNRVWCVAFGDQLFAYSGNKKRARHLARVGNDMIRSLPKQAVVDPNAFLEQFTAYMNAAVLPGGPSTPPIRVSL
jgi:hypothetical protein